MYKAVLISAVQQNDSYIYISVCICIYIHCHIIFHYGLSGNMNMVPKWG